MSGALHDRGVPNEIETACLRMCAHAASIDPAVIQHISMMISEMIVVAPITSPVRPSTRRTALPPIHRLAAMAGTAVAAAISGQ